MNKIDINNYITKQMKEVLDFQKEFAKKNPAILNSIEEGRENYIKERAYWNENSLNLKEEKRVIQGKHGDINIHIYYPNNNNNLSCTLFIHGGGFIVGSPKTHERMIKYFCKYSKSVVVAIDYKLSPEYKYPVAIQECAFIANYLHENAQNFNINKNRISLMGDSAGANIAFNTNLYLRDEYKNNSYIKTLILYYGLYGLKDSTSRRLLGNKYDSLTKEDIKYYEDCYFENNKNDKKYYDCLSADLSYNIPPTYMCVGNLDPLLDDSITLNELLQINNIPCQLQIYKGVMHAFLHYTKIMPEANEALKMSAEFFRNNQ